MVIKRSFFTNTPIGPGVCVRAIGEETRGRGREGTRDQGDLCVWIDEGG